MYMLGEQIDLGLLPGQNWPSEAHKIVAMRLCICNPMVVSRQHMMDVVQILFTFNEEEVKKATLQDLAKAGVQFYGA